MTVSSQIIEVLNDLCAKFGMVIDWSEENILPYVQTLITKFIAWEIATSWVWIGVAVLTFVIGAALIIIDYKINGYCFGVMIFLGCVLMFVAIATAVYQTLDIVKCNTFPEKAVFDYISTKIQPYG